MRMSVLLLFSVITTTTSSDYNTVVSTHSGNAVVLLVQDGCASCRRLENDLISNLRQAGIMEDSSIHIISVNRQPEVVKKLQGGGLNSMRGFPVVLVYRNKGGKQYGWRYIGYRDSVTMTSWLIGIKNWKPPRRLT